METVYVLKLGGRRLRQALPNQVRPGVAQYTEPANEGALRRPQSCARIHREVVPGRRLALPALLLQPRHEFGQAVPVSVQYALGLGGGPQQRPPLYTKAWREKGLSTEIDGDTACMINLQLSLA